METEQQAEAVVLSDKKIEQLSKQPIIESFVSRSQDGRWVVHKTIFIGQEPFLKDIFRCVEVIP